MFTATDGLKKILATKLIVRMILSDESGDACYTVTESEYNKAEKVNYLIVPAKHSRNADDIDTINLPQSVNYEDILVPADKVQKITMIKVGDFLTTADELKRFKKEASLTVDMYTELGYLVRFTKDYVTVGCQKHSWSEWERIGETLIERYFMYRKTKNEVLKLLPLVLANKDRILAKFDRAKKVTKKVAAKKTPVKKAAKKVTKKTTRK